MTTSPGDSSTPARSEPSMQQSAPEARAFAMSPEYCIPPSAITGMPYFAATLAQSKIAVTCGQSMPATILVVQIEPGPMPTLIGRAGSRVILDRDSVPVDQRLRRLGRPDVAGNHLHVGEAHHQSAHHFWAS